jgi:hypothetical protein
MGKISHIDIRRLGSICRKGKHAEIKGGIEHTCTVRQVAQLSSAVKTEMSNSSHLNFLSVMQYAWISFAHIRADFRTHFL